MLLAKQNCLLVVTIINILKVVGTLTSGLGPCPRLEYMESFNITRFQGPWYEIERSFYLMELVSSCVRIDLKANQKGQLEVVVSSKSRMRDIGLEDFLRIIYDKIGTTAFSISEGIATPSKKHPSLFVYKVRTKLLRPLSRYFPGSGHYQVVKTDYERYAIIYSCNNYQLAHLDMVWIWGRKREMNVDLRANIYKWLHDYHIDSDRLVLGKNVNCTDG